MTDAEFKEFMDLAEVWAGWNLKVEERERREVLRAYLAPFVRPSPSPQPKDEAPAIEALRAIRFAGGNTTGWATWAQRWAAWGMEPKKWPKPSTEAPQPPAEATDAGRLDWLLPNLHPANFGMEFPGGYEWEDEADYLRKWRAAIDDARLATPPDTKGGA